MTSATHTPGPWSEGITDWSVDNDGENTCVHILADNRDDPVCIVVEGAAYGRDAQLDANARLIAAAPAMLGALETAVALLEIWRGWTPGYSTAHTDFESLPEVRKARAAIHQATGNAS
jgi:hypothetical protein